MIHPTLGQDKNEFAVNQVMIKFNSKATSDAVKKIHSRINATVIEDNDFLGFQIISSTKSVTDMIKYYRSLKETEYVRPNYKVQIT